MAVTFRISYLGMTAAFGLSVVRSSPHHLLAVAGTVGASEVRWAPNLFWWDYHISRFPRETDQSPRSLLRDDMICRHVMRRSPHHITYFRVTDAIIYDGQAVRSYHIS